MNKKNIIIISSIVGVILIITVIVLFVLKPNSQSTKKIIGTSLKQEMEVVPNIVKQDDMVLILDGNEQFYFKYENNKLVYENLINKDNGSNYVVKEKYDGVYYIENKKTKEKSEEFVDYVEIKNDKKVLSYLLKMENKYVILNTETDKYVTLDSNIFDFSNIYDAFNKLISDKYIVVINSKDKYGVIDFNGNIIIKMDYQFIQVTKNNFIVKKDNKVGIMDINGKFIIENKYNMLFEYNDKYLSILNGKYGVIDSKGNELLEHKYNNAVKRNEHIAFEIDGKIGIFTDKIVFEPTLELSDTTKLSTYKFNDNIHILTNDKTYVINNGKIIKTIDKKLFTVLIDGKEGVYSDKYIYARETNELTSKFEIFDANYNLKYSFEVKENPGSSNYIMSSNISTVSDKIYNVNITLIPQAEGLEPINKIYQHDIDNNKEISVNDLEKYKLENGLTFTIDSNNVLRIYNKDNVIGEYENILYFIDNYYFIDVNGVVYKLNFEYKEESH